MDGMLWLATARVRSALGVASVSPKAADLRRAEWDSTRANSAKLTAFHVRPDINAPIPLPPLSCAHLEHTVAWNPRRALPVMPDSCVQVSAQCQHLTADNVLPDIIALLEHRQRCLALLGLIGTRSALLLPQTA